MAAVTPGRRTRKAPGYDPASTTKSQLYQEPIRKDVRRAQYHVDGYFQNAVPANQTNAVLTRLQGAAPEAWVAPRDGNVMTVWVQVDAARTAGTLVVHVFKNGNLMANLSAQLDAVNTTYKASAAARGQVPFNPGDSINLRVTTTGWTPTTANLRAGMEVEV